MESKDLISIRPDNEEILNLLERIRVLGSAVVEVGSTRFVVNVRSETISTQGRAFLAKGGPVED